MSQLSTEMVERVARTLYEVDSGRAVSETEWSTLAGRLVYRGLARAAIHAMKEPTEAMVKIGSAKHWPLMIDEALR